MCSVIVVWVLDTFGTARPNNRVLYELFRRQKFFEQQGKLDLSIRATNLDVGENVFQITDARSERLHLAYTLVDALQVLDYSVEGFAQARI
jgi:hypothetical protein